MLAAIVKAYIETGEPVGSKILTGLLDNAPSSATLRSEMNELCSLGLLTQPHTSAGRIPTSSGYRVYVETLMKPSAPEESTKRYLDSLLDNSGGDLRAMPERAAQALCELTGFPAVACYFENTGVYVKRVELIKIGVRSAALLLIASNGHTESRICHLPSVFTAEGQKLFERLVNKHFRLKSLSEFDRAFLQTVIADAGMDSFTVMPFITELFDMAQSVNAAQVKIIGAANLYHFCAEDTARRILSLAERTEPFISYIRGHSEKNVIFGSETGFPELNGTVIALTSYRCGKQECGKIGIIASDRMTYEQILPSIIYTAGRLTARMSQAVKDMED